LTLNLIWGYNDAKMIRLPALLVLTTALAHAAEQPFTTAADVTAYGTARLLDATGHPAQLSGTVDSHVCHGTILTDTTGAILIRPEPYLASWAWQPGDQLSVFGHIQTSRQGEIVVKVTDVRKTGHVTPAEPANVTVKDIAAGRITFRRVRLRGVVTNAFRDEIDPNWNWLYLTADGASTVVAFSDANMKQETLTGLVDATVDVTGVSLPALCGDRSFPGAYVEIASLDDLKVLEPPAADPFAAPEYREFSRVPDVRSPHYAHRQRLFGRVLATWRGDRLLLVTPERHRLLARIRRGTSLPAVGETISLVGFIRRDAFFTFLTDGLYRPETCETIEPEPSELLSLEDAFIGNEGYSAFAFGRPMRITGTVRSVTSAKTPYGRLLVDADGQLVPVEFGAGDPPEIGSVVEVTGLCVTTAESDDWDIGFGRLRGFFLVPRQQDDVRIVRAAPWWTPTRLMIVIGSLVGALVAILLWNVLLRRLAERQGKELFKSQIASVTSLLRIDERTRLAVELHDALSQQLTAVAYEIAAAESVRVTEPDTSAGHLSVASQMLRSCRTELRRCLWDLRSEALDEKDFAEAIRRTVKPVIGEAELSIRFNVSRARIGDLTAHAVLCIIRELAANAVRHGKALHIHIAGERKDNGLRFSVRDDGCGFDPATAPGSSTGHFGLTGIRDRINRQGGTFDLDSRRGTGTRVVVSLP